MFQNVPKHRYGILAPERWRVSGIWPGDIRCVVVLTFDIDGVSGALNVDPESARFPGLMSVREYGPSVGVPRILDLLDELGVPASFYVPGYVAETHEDMVRDIARRGHEIAHHGYMHEPPALCPESGRSRCSTGVRPSSKA